jgi:hypothetical protein
VSDIVAGFECLAALIVQAFVSAARGVLAQARILDQTVVKDARPIRFVLFPAI